MCPGLVALCALGSPSSAGRRPSLRRCWRSPTHRWRAVCGGCSRGSCRSTRRPCSPSGGDRSTPQCAACWSRPACLPCPRSSSTCCGPARWPAASTLWLLDAAYVLTETGASLAGVGFFALFPVGRPERRYERVIVRTAVAMALLVPALVLVARPELTVNPFSFPDFPPVANPTFVPALAPIGGLVLAAYVGFWMVALPLAALMLALRYRRSGFAERRQIRWLLLGVSVGALGTLPWVLGLNALGAVIGVPCMLATVGCIVVALLDAGLLDVDAIIRKSLVYGILWLLIALGFVAAASVLGVAASRELPLAVAITLAITAAWAVPAGPPSAGATGGAVGVRGAAEPLRGGDQVRRRPGGGGRSRRPAPEAGRHGPAGPGGAVRQGAARPAAGAPACPDAAGTVGHRRRARVGHRPRPSRDPGRRDRVRSEAPGSVHGRRHPSARHPRPTGGGRRLRPAAAYRAGRASGRDQPTLRRAEQVSRQTGRGAGRRAATAPDPGARRRPTVGRRGVGAARVGAQPAAPR